MMADRGTRMQKGVYWWMGEARLEWAGWAYRGVCIPHPGDSRPGAFFEVGQRAWCWALVGMGGVIDISVPLKVWFLKTSYWRWSSSS